MSKAGRRRATGFQPAGILKREQKQAIMFISLALEESTVDAVGPKSVEDERGFGEDGDTEVEEEEEGRRSVGSRGPKMPTKVEQEEHARTHCPYRSWCRRCVKSRARNSPHEAVNLRDEESEGMEKGAEHNNGLLLHVKRRREGVRNCIHDNG